MRDQDLQFDRGCHVLYSKPCKAYTDLAEIKEMEGDLFLLAFRKLAAFANCNKPFFHRLMHLSFCNAKKQCDKLGDYQMYVAPSAAEGICRATTDWTARR